MRMRMRRVRRADCMMATERIRIVRDRRSDAPRIAVQTEFRLARRRLMPVAPRVAAISVLP
jgi:hypothetical protein